MPVDVYQSLSLMISFATLVLLILTSSNKKK
ncbi:putative holin-like toxin [Paenibacillus cisolokensis]